MSSPGRRSPGALEISGRKSGRGSTGCGAGERVIGGDAARGDAYRRTAGMARAKPRRKATRNCQLPTRPRAVGWTGGSSHPALDTTTPEPHHTITPEPHHTTTMSKYGTRRLSDFDKCQIVALNFSDPEASQSTALHHPQFRAKIQREGYPEGPQYTRKTAKGQLLWRVKKTGRGCDVPESSKEVVEGDGK
jgi:hypothetical protein